MAANNGDKRRAGSTKTASGRHGGVKPAGKAAKNMAKSAKNLKWKAMAKVAKYRRREKWKPAENAKAISEEKAAKAENESYRK